MTLVNLRDGSARSPARRLLFAGALIWLVAASSEANCAPFNPDEIAQIDKVVSDALAKSGAPSASVAVVRDGEIVFAKAYGLRKIEPQEAATPTTRYRIASVSKQFTAAAILMLADDGKLSLDDEVARYLPDLAGGAHVTLRQALSHTAGYPDFWSVDFLPIGLKRPISPSAIAKRWGTEPLEFQPGSKWAYSNTGYVVLGRVVESVSGKSLGAFLKARIFAPLHMDSADDFDGSPLTKTDATGYSRAALGPDREAAMPAAGWTFGAGELAMTASDLARWDISVIDRTLMSPAAYQAQETEVKLTDGSGSGYGFGLWVDSVGGHRRLRHHGDLPGFWTENRVYPEDRAAIVVTINASYGASPHIVIANGIERLLIPAANAPPSQYAIARKLYQQIGAGTLDRSLLTAEANDYLSGTVLSDYQSTFAKYGEPLAFITLRTNVTAGSTWNQWMAVLPAGKLSIVMRSRPDGKIEEFLATPLD
jgi:D-alanyl-D-alanine carboxypeptidase